MSETRKFGRIFFPESPEEEINGVWLNIKNGSIFLETPHSSLSDQNWQIILGEFNGLDKVTFVNCLAGGGSSGSGGTWRNIHVSYLLKNCHINNYSDLLFNTITLNSPSLSSWIKETNSINKIDGYTYKIPQDEFIFSVLISDVEFTLLITYSQLESSNCLNVEKQCLFKIDSSEALHVSEFSKLMSRIKKWILFVTNKNPEFSRYYLSNDSLKGIELVNTMQNLKEDRFTQNISLNYFDMRDNLESVFENWMITENIETIIDLLQEKNYNTEMTFQSYFLNMCVAIESFHSIYNYETEKNEIEKRMKVKESVLTLIEDQELKKSFCDLSIHWSKPTYRERLKSFKPTIEIIMGNTFKLKFSKFVTKIVNTRNSLAHNGTYDGELKHIELLLIGKVLEFTLKYEILNLLKYKSMREDDFLEDAKSHVNILAELNEYNKNPS